MRLFHKGLCILNSHLNAHLVIFPIQIQPNNINIPPIHYQTFLMVQGDICLMSNGGCKEMSLMQIILVVGGCQGVDHVQVHLIHTKVIRKGLLLVPLIISTLPQVLYLRLVKCQFMVFQ